MRAGRWRVRARSKCSLRQTRKPASAGKPNWIGNARPKGFDFSPRVMGSSPLWIMLLDRIPLWAYFGRGTTRPAKDVAMMAYGDELVPVLPEHAGDLNPMLPELGRSGRRRARFEIRLHGSGLDRMVRRFQER